MRPKQVRGDTSLETLEYSRTLSRHVTSGVVEGGDVWERRSPEYFWGTPFPKMISGQGGTVILHEIW